MIDDEVSAALTSGSANREAFERKLAARVEPQSAQSTARAASRPKPPSQAQAEPPNVIKLAKERLRFLGKEIKRLEGDIKRHRAEHDQLRRLLGAANEKTPGKVRSLRSAG